MENEIANTVREYRTDDLIVYWDAEKCSHAAFCWKNAPDVFKPKERPWINLESAAPEEVIKIIDLCPSGALKYKLPAGSKVDPAFAQGPGSIEIKPPQGSAIKIKMTRQGPIKVEGLAQIFDSDGQLIRESDQMMLCTCGESGKRPFCDGSYFSKKQ